MASYPAEVNRSWKLSAFAGGRAIDFQSRFNVRENVRGAPTSIQFSGQAPMFPTRVHCYAEADGRGMETVINVPANGKLAYPVKFKSWMVVKNGPVQNVTR
ncbi:hypothetical protein C8A01DRAFT_37759 [Parachaetomium inaequale]|uniref:Uncharacterized protein n=1 Tax=Parachaetomium inaequale TaxID=2588326 RepID=A0AAN6SQD5_9PEZI|nr:hypothetical protein C8A01DRAFT_37759 [Parachaetomium inaequale]